ncbi:hypothetical protein IMG5_201740 [Ichthyophthirius multifiliis]|uniref:Uncharacterized protein n=1 Tax=Ichthyophthirius multifiliis TaxID=5932 RepID=G0R5X2_ICHMU|nr:hypothetical protein IMG5_201740 [Ichthyophthirius multifiliis]EGR27149.1 hypothetical protein IMG5_201740 [Ichthyophthirius multifiliis]|eukprot:XP_004024033.1 hypothetical protein IMG5_201740 [Ichthyophthirius multifiliis]
MLQQLQLLSFQSKTSQNVFLNFYQILIILQFIESQMLIAIRTFQYMQLNIN